MAEDFHNVDEAEGGFEFTPGRTRKLLVGLCTMEGDPELGEARKAFWVWRNA